jgi:hypothetical protein
MGWGRAAVQTRAPGAKDVAAVPIVTEPGSIQFIPHGDETSTITGMIFACPSGHGALTLLRFGDTAEGGYTWNGNVSYPGIIEEVYVARTGWRGFLREGRWIGEVEKD